MAAVPQPGTPEEQPDLPTGVPEYAAEDIWLVWLVRYPAVHSCKCMCATGCYFCLALAMICLR